MKIGKTTTALAEYLKTSRLVRWILLGMIMAVFAVILYPNLLVKNHIYTLGEVAEKNIKAPIDFFIEDKEATEKKQHQAAAEILTVYDYDSGLMSKISGHVEKSFQMLQAIARPPEEEVTESASLSPEDLAERKKLRSKRIWEKKADFEKELGISVSDGAFKVLEKEDFSEEISGLIREILTQILDNGVVANKEGLLRETERGIALRTVGTRNEQVVRNLRKFHGMDQAKEVVRIVGEPLVKNISHMLINRIVDISQRLIQPNITLNRSETEERIRKARAAIKPVLYQIKAGEMLLREGERVTAVHLLKLDTLRKQTRQEKPYARSLGALMMIFSLLIVTYFLHTRPRGQRVLATNRDVLFMAVTLVIFFLVPGASEILFESLSRHLPFPISELSRVFGIPLAGSAMTVCLFMGFEVAVTFSLIIAACTAVILQNRFEFFLYFFLSGIMAAYWMRNCRERKVFVRAGLKLGILNALLATGVAIYMGEFTGFGLPWHWAFAFAGGIGSGIITAGIIPLLELAFNYTTDITLLELANLERPILRRLMMEAPGTYHHSVVVGSMVEAAAAEIGANPLLAKVCGYYHDIGKIRKPLYFIENQRDGRNRHDKLAPSMSSLILVSHVKEGVEMARQHKLGQEITDAIRQHHGTSTIRYFFEKARQLKGGDKVKIENYQYPGPKPQTREIGLVMLADVVEAASRTLENPTPSRIRGLVQTLIDKIFSDGQLDNCELTLKDLHNIKESFNKILNGIYHHRIEYPEKNAAKNGKEKNGSTHHQSARPAPRLSGEGAENSPDPVKRAGLS